MGKNTTRISIVTAIYVVLCLIFEPFSFGPLQFRVAEILCLLSINYSWAIISVSLGCFISNMLFGGLGIIDVLIGTIATFIASFLANKFKNIKYKNIPVVSILSIVLTNAILIGIEFGLIYNNKIFIPIYMLQIGLSELITIIIGLPIYFKIINKIK